MENIIGSSRQIKEIKSIIGDISKSPSTILIDGESGTGKELIASAIHLQSKRALKPFIAVNCAAIPDALLESELFGHEKGSFTGAVDKHIGKFEAANEGTIFLDEIGTLSPSLQAKLLRVLQEKTIERVGGTKTISIDVRIISATNTDLKEEIKSRNFREDLFYRLNVIPITLPPLRERQEDIPLLIDYFLGKFSKENRKNIKGFDKKAMEALIEYEWPGNIRELQNIIERVIVLNKGPNIKFEELPKEIVKGSPTAVFNPFGGKKEKNEKESIEEALKRSDGNQSKAAKLLGLHRNTLRSKIKELGIN